MAMHIREEHCGLSIANAPKSLGHKSKPMPTEVKLCLLTCCLFPDVSRIPIDDLVMYLMGLKLFEDVDNMSAARCRVHDLISIINNLKYPYNVIGGKIRLTNHEKNEPHNHYVKMPVGAHDLAKLMHLSCPLVFHRQTIKRKWPESNCYKDCYGLSLLLKKINKYPLYLECPKLALLLLHYREDSQVIPVDFFEGMKELCILSLDVPSLPQSLNVPWNPRTLRIKVIKLDMSWIGGLTNLEFLSISTSSLTNIPREMGHLEKLRLLDLKKVNLAYIPPGVLSRMLKLEELYLPSNFGRWGCKAKEFDDDEEWELGEEDDENTISNGIDDGEKINASLIEIVSPSLNALNIGIPSASFLPKKSPIFKNIRQFKVHVPNYIKYQPVGKDLSNELHLIGDACDIKESGICDLMSRTEELSLIRVKNLKNVIYFIENNDFLLLKKMIISECEELECVVDATEKQISSENNYSFWKLESLHLSMLYNLKEICNERWRTFQWFQNLSEISIRFCHKLKYVFPMSLFSKGILLKNIEIIDCNEMEGVFYEDEEANVPLMHGSIENLDLHSLPKLIGFSVPEVNIIDGVHEDANQSLTANEIISNCKEGSISTFDGNFKSLAPNGSTSTLKESCVYDEQLIGVTQQLLSSKQVALFKIKDDIIGPMEMYYAFSSKLAEKWLQNLKRLKLAFCDSITIIFLFDPNHATSEVFISLKELELYGLRNLVHIWFQVPQKTFAFMNLQLLVLSECNNMYLFTPQVAKRLVQLKKLYISRCEKMEEVIVKGDGQEAKNKILFRRLKLLEFQYMPNLKIFSSGIYEVLFPLLDSLKTIQCNKMKSFSSGISWTPSLERVEINGNLYSFMGDLNATMKCEGKPYGHIFTFAELKHATQNFKLDNVLGQGGFGKVYKGWLDEKTFSPSKIGSGMVVAIKKLHRGSLQGFKAWQSEVTFLEGESHPNLVKLLGYCSEDEELLLVYEFMQNGSLDNHLFKRNSAGATLSWDRRIKIAIGVARGLHFLHTSKHKVIHRHIKPSNILIDSDYNARISDFGFARFDGTYGYVAPENIMTGHLYDKSDVYSFGVVLLEMMTGLRVIDMGYPNEQKNLVDWLKPILLRERKLKSIMDVRIEGQYLSKAMLLVAQLAFKCVQSHPINRPSMKDVLDALEQIDAINDEPLYVPSPRLRS